MIIKKLLIFQIAFILSFLLCVNSHAAGVSLDHMEKQDIQQHKEKSQAVERTREQRKSKSQRQEQKKEEAIKKSLQKAVKQAIARKNDSSLKITLNTNELFYSIVARLEQSTQPFCSCKLISNPPTLQNIGLGFEQDGMVDLTMKEYLESKAAGDGIVELNTKEIKRIFSCALQYSQILASANFQLAKMKDLQDWLGLQDLRKYAKIAILTSIQKPDPGVQELINTAKESFFLPCRLRKSLDTLLCGAVGIEIRPTLQVFLGKQPIYGHRFLFNGEWTISTAYSLDKTWEKIKSLAKDSSTVKSLAKSIEQLESQGNIKKAALLKRQAIQAIREGRFNLNLNPTSLK